jgi:hypothetical protein
MAVGQQPAATTPSVHVGRNMGLDGDRDRQHRFPLPRPLAVATTLSPDPGGLAKVLGLW